MEAQSIEKIDLGFSEEVESAGPFNLTACFQCRKCSNGCPASFAMDLPPDLIIRLALLGQKDEILRSRTIWVCASCETCTTRCPNGVRIAELMDHFRELAVREGVPVPHPEILSFHQTFVDNIRRTGRAFEGALIPEYRMRSGSLKKMWKEGRLKEEAALGWTLLRKKRLALYPKFIRGRDEVRSLLDPIREGTASRGST